MPRGLRGLAPPSVLAVVLATVGTSPAAAAPATAGTEPPPLEIVLTVDGATLRTAPSPVVVLTGTLRCSEPVSEIFGAGTVSQAQGRSGRPPASAEFFTDAIACSTTPTHWTATTEVAPRAFLPRDATVVAGFGGCNSDCGEALITRTLRLRLAPHAS